MSIDIKQAYRLSLRILFAGLLSVACIPALHADEWDKATKFTFPDPVQIPGQVLPAGTYWFRLLDKPGERHIVEVFDESNQHLIATVLAIPDYRVEPKGRTTLKFAERAGGQPDAVKEWFYPGDNFGHEFVYPKGEELQTAQATITTTPIAPTPEPAPEPVAAAPPAVESAAPAEAAPEAAQPEQQPETQPAAAPAPAPEESTPAPAEPESLPQTGSDLPLIGLLGFSSLGSGVLFHLLRRR